MRSDAHRIEFTISIQGAINLRQLHGVRARLWVAEEEWAENVRCSVSNQEDITKSERHPHKPRRCSKI